MVSFQVRCRLAAVSLAIAAIAATGLPRSAAAETAFEPVAKDPDQKQLVETIREAQLQGGPYSPELIEPLSELGVLYRESGDGELAAAATERALQVLRVNVGLYSLDQLPLLRQSIENANATGDAEAAQQLERDLKALIRRHPDDLRTVPALRELGDNQMTQLRRFLAGEFPPQFRISNGRYFDPEFGSRSAIANSIVMGAWRYYAEAAQVLWRHKDYTSEQLGELEMEILRICHLNGSYGYGRASLLRQVAYGVAREEPLLARVNALIRVADWDLAFTHNGMALDLYEETYALLKQNGTPAEAIEEIFSPQVPVLLPTFLPNPLATDEAGSTGYIDVAFEIHKYGSGQNVAILRATPNATDADKDELVRVIRTGDFRPRVTADEFERTSPVVLRYFLHGLQSRL